MLAISKKLGLLRPAGRRVASGIGAIILAKRLSVRHIPAAAGLSAAMRRSVAQLARAPVSKTGGWGFESLHSCQPRKRR